jgi:hypothetical protein
MQDARAPHEIANREPSDRKVRWALERFPTILEAVTGR